MKKHSFKEWIIATRPWSFPASAMPVLVTLGYLFWRQGEADWPIGLFTIINVVLFHAAGNTWSDYRDYRSGVDREDAVGGMSIVSGEFAPEQIKRLSISLMAVAMICGFVLVALTGWITLWLGMAGAALTVMYPWLKYRALGDVDIFLTYAVLPMLGTSYVVTGNINPESLWLAVPVGLITVGILHSNNTRDMEQDRRAGIRTFAMAIGGKASSYLYCFEVIFPFLWCVAGIVAGLFPVCIITVFAVLKPAIDNARKAMCYPKEGMKALVGLDESTAKLQLMFSLALFGGFMIAAFVA